MRGACGQDVHTIYDYVQNMSSQVSPNWRHVYEHLRETTEDCIFYPPPISTNTKSMIKTQEIGYISMITEGLRDTPFDLENIDTANTIFNALFDVLVNDGFQKSWRTFILYDDVDLDCRYYELLYQLNCALKALQVLSKRQVRTLKCVAFMLEQMFFDHVMHDDRWWW